MGHRVPLTQCAAPLSAFSRSHLQCRLHVFGIQLKRSFSATGPFARSSPELLNIRDVPAPHIGHIRIIGLNSPHNRNAISKQLLTELGGAVKKLKGHDGRSGETRALILASEIDEAFCAGADLKERKQMSDDETHEFLIALRSTLNDLSRLSIPTISVVTSNALGGGFELALATHLRIFTNVTTVAFPETQLGIIPGAGGTYRLRHLVGESRAHEMILAGRNINGRQAYEWGVCNWILNTDKSPNERLKLGKEIGDVQKSRVYAKKGSFDYRDGGKRRAKAMAYALSIATSVCEGAPVAVGAALESVRAANEDVENRMYERCLTIGAADRAEGLTAFKEKRSPRYRGEPKDSEDVKDLEGLSDKLDEEMMESTLADPKAEEEELGNSENIEDLEEYEDSEQSETSEGLEGYKETELETPRTSEGEEEAEEPTHRDNKNSKSDCDAERRFV